MRKTLLISIILLFPALIFGQTTRQEMQKKVEDYTSSYQNSEGDKRKFKNFIENHPYLLREPIMPSELKKLPKYDRPDLAAEFEQLITLDPSLGYVPQGRAFAAYEEAKRRLKIKSSYRAIQNVTWTERGPNNVAGRTRAFMFDPNDVNVEKVWAGGVIGGLWYNNDITDPNSSWVSIDDFWTNLSITSMAYAPTNTQVFYVTTGDLYSSSRGGGVWKTTDGGTTWNNLASTVPAENGFQNGFTYINKVVVDASGNVYLAARGNGSGNDDRGGILKSTDDGASWTQVLSVYGLNSSYNDRAQDIEIASNGILYASFGDGGTVGKIFRSTDNTGTSWTDITPTTGTTPARVEIALARSTDGTVSSTTLYALAARNGGGSTDVAWIKRSDDGGASWSDLAIPNYLGDASRHFTRGQAWYDLVIEVHPTDPDFVIVGGIDICRSTNGGASWTTISDWRSTTSTRVYVHADQHNFLWRPGTTTEVISTSDGGVSYCTNITSTSIRANFADHNKDYNVTQFYAVAMKNIANSDHLLAGAQDNGTQIIRTGGVASSNEVTGGDGAFCFADQDTPDNQISSYVYNAYYRTINDWNSYGSLSGTGGLFINPADLDDTNDILYASSSANSMMRYSNIFTNSPSTEQVSVNTGGSTISAVHVDAFNPNRVYVGTFSGNLFRIDNANTATPSVTTVTGTMNTGTIKGIDVSSAGEIIVVSSSYGEASVWFSPDGGTTWVDKDEAAHGLPDMPVRDVLFDPNNSDRVLLATEVGVWSSDDVKASNPGWEPTSIDLANVRCDMFKYRESDGLVAVATYGRGVFTTDIFDPISCAPPTALMLSNGTTSTVDVSWTAGASETAWEIEYGTTGFTLGTGTNATVTSTTYALTGLVGGGQYEFYVRAICGPSDNSSWSKISIQTELCDLSSQCTYQIVLSDSYGDSWNGGEISILQNGIQTHTFGTELPNGSASVSVSFNVCDGANLEVKVVSTGLYPSEMGFEIYDNFGILVDELPQGSSFANGDILMAFGVNCAGGCYKPVSLAATSVGTTQIGVTWVGNSPSAIGYEVEYGPIGFTQGTGTTVSVSGTSYTITGLTASTGYDVYVSSLCSGARQSDATLLSVYTFPCQTTDQCDYSFTLLDDYGDGWNGALIDVVQYGTPTTLLGDGFTTGGSQLVSGVKICHGATVSLVVRENGSFSYEIGLEANNEMGTLVGSHPDGASFADGATLFSFRGQCTSELSVSLSPTQVLEDDDQLSFMFTFTSSRVALEDIRVNFNVGGTATYNNDYYLVRGANTFTATLGSVIIPAGQTSVTLVLQSQQDAIEEGDETIILSLLSVE